MNRQFFCLHVNIMNKYFDRRWTLHYRIYLDVLFIVNFVMDYVVLSLMSGILKNTVSHIYIKKLLASAIGALWVCTVVLFRLYNPIFYAVGYMVIATVMTVIITKTRKVREIVKGVGILYAVTCSLGGLLHVLYYYTTVGYFIHTLSEKSRIAMPLWLLAAGTVTGMPFLKYIYSGIADKISRSSLKNMAEIVNDGKKVRVRALIDSGNSLIDPFTGEGVNVAEQGVVDKLISSYEECAYHLIPYSSVGRENGLIPVVRFEQLTLRGEEDTYVIKRPLFALYSGHFSKTADYEVIIHPNMVNSRSQYTNV